MSDLETDSPSILRRYGMAALCTAGAVLLRWLLDPIVGSHLPLASIFGFVGIAVWYGGWGPALTTVIGSYLAVSWLFSGTQDALSFSAKDVWGLSLYLFSTLVLIGVGEAMRQAQRQARTSAAATLARQRQLEAEIEERKRVETALRRSEGELSEFFEHASLGIHWVGPDGIVLRVNQAELDLLGYSRDEYVGHHIAECHVDQLVIEDILTRLMRGETLRECSARLRCKDGSIRDVLINANGLFENGQLVHTRCFTLDVTDRKRVEEALRISEARFREVIQRLPAAIYTCDAQGRIQLHNEAAVVLWGRKPEIGKDQWCGSWNIYRPDGTLLPLDECPMAVTLREGRAVRGEEIVIERPDGTRRHVLPHPEPVRDANGEVVGAVNMLIDISDRKQAELAQAHLAAIVTSSEDAIVGKDLAGIVTSWNGAAQRLFGYGADEMIGRSITRLIPPERHYEERRILDHVARGIPIEPYETIRRRKDGTEFHVSLTVSPVCDAQGRVMGASKIARDITHKVRQEQALVESREKLRHALEYQDAVVSNLAEGLYTVNGEGLVISMNRTAERLFGWTSEELVGRNMHDMTHHKRRDGTPFPAEECGELQVLRKGLSLTNQDDVFIRKDGSCFDVVYSSAPIRAGNTIVGLVVLFRDVSEQKRVEEALRDRDRALTIANDELTQQSAALADANNELQSFSYSVSHDLRAPLRTIDAYVRIVEEDHGPLLNDEARRCLGIVKKAAGQAGELIDDLLEFCRLGRVGMDLRPVKMADLAREGAKDLEVMLEDRIIDLTIGDLPPCQGDWRLLKLVWANLLSNAFKFTRYRASAQIEVGWLPDDRQADALVYYVKDNGVGFDMKYAHKLFSVFQRLHLKDEFDGTGVGLAMAQRIVHRHGGRVWAEGKIDHGATFFFSLRKALR